MRFSAGSGFSGCVLIRQPWIFPLPTSELRVCLCKYCTHSNVNTERNDSQNVVRGWLTSLDNLANMDVTELLVLSCCQLWSAVMSGCSTWCNDSNSWMSKEGDCCSRQQTNDAPSRVAIVVCVLVFATLPLSGFKLFWLVTTAFLFYLTSPPVAVAVVLHVYIASLGGGFYGCVCTELFSVIFITPLVWTLNFI